MNRIANVTLPQDKRLEVALTYIYGIGRTSSLAILEKAKIDSHIRTKDLTAAQIQTLNEIIDQDYVTESNLQKIVFGNIKRLQDIRAYRGLRHKAKLPTRGQRTRTNARTRRGKKVTVGGTAKKAPSKT